MYPSNISMPPNWENMYISVIELIIFQVIYLNALDLGG